LKRAFAEAHRNHLQSHARSSAASHHIEPRSSNSLPNHESKRRKTHAAPSPYKTTSTGASKQEPVTYGKQSKFLFSSPYIDTVNEQTGCDVVDPTNEPTPNEAAWVESTIHHNYAQHDPDTAFPEPSSTIPNATLTQQRVLEGVAAPAFLGHGSELDGQRYEPPQPSVPWSDILKLSPIDPTERPDSSNQQLESEPVAPHVQTPQKSHECSVSQRSRRGSSTQLRGSPLRKELLPECVDPLETLRPPIEPFSSQDLDLPLNASTKSQTTVLKGVQISSRKEKNRATLLPNSDNDLTAIGLPIEQYKPRPSRSRSLKVDTQESVDYSVRPEKPPRTSKRRKTTHVAISPASTPGNPSSTPEKVQQICDMGFTPGTTKSALKRNNGDVTQSIDWLINNGIGEDELAPHNIPKRKPTSRALKTDQATSAVESHKPVSPNQGAELHIAEVPYMNNPRMEDDLGSPKDATNNTVLSSNNGAHMTTVHTKNSRVQVLIPMKSPQPKSMKEPDLLIAPSKKAKRRKTTSDLPEPQANGEVSTVPRVTTEKKKGRGRPKKVPNAAAAIEIVQELSEEKHPREAAGGVLQTIEVNTTTPKPIQDHLEEAIDTPKEQPAYIADKGQDQHLASKTPSNKVAPSPSSHTLDPTVKLSSNSPVTKGKVPHRVGLSRRQRIAPLLRIMKK
jgi:hypothetical protein